MNGYEFLNAVRLRPEWVSIPFIFLTAKTEKEDIRTGKLHGVDDYVTKPFDLPDLLVAVQATLNRHRQLNALQEQEMENLRQQILKILNHEFRTPLTYIVAYADLMANSPTFKHSEELRQYISGILVGSDRLSHLVGSLLLLAELESGNGRRIFERRKVLIDNVGSLVQDVIGQLQGKASARDLTLHVLVGSSLPPVMGDPEYLQVALEHLIENAIKFSPESERASVSVALEAHDNSLVIIVCDEGAGIPAEEYDHVFVPFYQYNRDTQEQQGVGAGLAIARHVAILHGGRVEVVSKSGHGSCFLFILPVYQGNNH
jgi:signal transduction histidine kinase